FHHGSRSHFYSSISWPKPGSLLKLSRLGPGPNLDGRPFWKNLIVIGRCFNEASRGALSQLLKSEFCDGGTLQIKRTIL
ncbi:MAG: hypothetical protein ACRCW3_03440, partial [Metamycoplasmataceae bacterium]